MQIRVFTLPFNTVLGAFDDEPLRAFLVDKEELAVDSRFFLKDGVPHWTVLLQYNLTKNGSGARPEAAERRALKEDCRRQLDKSQRGVFNRLRECLCPDVARSITADAVLEVLAELMARHGVPAHIRSDNGSEFIAKEMWQWLEEAGVETLYIAPGAPWQTVTPNPSTAAYATGSSRWITSTP